MNFYRLFIRYCEYVPMYTEYDTCEKVFYGKTYEEALAAALASCYDIVHIDYYDVSFITTAIEHEGNIYIPYQFCDDDWVSADKGESKDLTTHPKYLERHKVRLDAEAIKAKNELEHKRKKDLELYAILKQQFENN